MHRFLSSCNFTGKQNNSFLKRLRIKKKCLNNLIINSFLLNVRGKNFFFSSWLDKFFARLCCVIFFFSVALKKLCTAILFLFRTYRCLRILHVVFRIPPHRNVVNADGFNHHYGDLKKKKNPLIFYFTVFFCGLLHTDDLKQKNIFNLLYSYKNVIKDKHPSDDTNIKLCEICTFLWFSGTPYRHKNEKSTIKIFKKCKKYQIFIKS